MHATLTAATSNQVKEIGRSSSDQHQHQTPNLRPPMSDRCTIRLTRCWCIECGALFLVPSPFLDAKIRESDEMFCPNGHSGSYSDLPSTAGDPRDGEECKTVLEKLATENKKLRRQLTKAL